MQIQKAELRLGNVFFARLFPLDCLPVPEEVKKCDIQDAYPLIPYPIGAEMKLGVKKPPKTNGKTLHFKNIRYLIKN